MRPIPDPIGPGQRSVWDFPRPPALEPESRPIRVVVAGRTIAQTTRAWKVLETSHPPTYYLPHAALDQEVFVPTVKRSFCEWKGRAAYFDLVVDGKRIQAAAWTYPDPTAPFAAIANHVAMYAWAVDEVWVGEELARPQPGGFYGGWVTNDVVGPFKGQPGTEWW